MIIIYNIRKVTNAIHNKFILFYKKVKYDNSLRINGKLNIVGTGEKIVIGKNVKINSGENINQIGGDTVTTLNGKIYIGSNVGISNSTLIAKKQILIEDDVMIGGSCKIYDTDFHSIEYEKRMQNPDIHIKSKEILIKKGAFIGAHSIILKGVTIGEKSVIGAGSVVTHDIPDNEIWAGNPAIFIKKVN